jgi:hypothetical protein
MTKELPSEIVFTTDVPVHIVVRRDGTNWRIDKVVVDDENPDLDLKHIRANNAKTDAELTVSDPVVQAAFSALHGEWPSWEFGW